MTFKQFAIAYITVLVTFALLDGVWLGVIAMPLYLESFGDLLRQPFITWPWIVFYIVYCAITVLLAIKPNAGKPLLSSTIAGFLLGAAAYGTYNLTGYSIIEGWPLNMTIIDWVWGSVGTALIATSGALALSKAG